MQRRTIAPAIVLLALAAAPSLAQDAAILKVEGRGIEGRPAYREGGVVKFLDVAIDAQVVHHQADQPIALPLAVQYEVLQPAPILLTSRLGTEHWQLYHFDTEAMSAMYSDQKIDLAQPGKHSAQATRAWFGKNYGPPPQPGLVGIRGHYYLLIDQVDGQWIDVTEPPAFLNQTQVLRDLVFTLADLTNFELSIPEIQSTWQPGGPLRVRLVVRDAQGQEQPIVGAPVVVTHSGSQAQLTTQWTPLAEPTGWMCGTLPASAPERLTVSADVTLQTPSGLQTRNVKAEFSRGSGQVSPDQLKVAQQGYQLPSDTTGTARETRAIWLSTSDIETAENIDRLVVRCQQAGLNVLVPDIFVRNGFYAKSHLMPIAGSLAKDFDPLGYLIQKAHAARLEVHPWFCVTYRDRQFRQWFAETYQQNIDMLDSDGKIIDLGADVHRPQYRQFIVDLMVGVARDYHVDGIHLDYIRTMGRCYCPSCRREFAETRSGSLADATDQAWLPWQREAISDIVRRTALGGRKARPNAVLSAAVFASLPGGAAQGQDPARWAAEGWIDLVIPMDYQMQTLQVRSNERQFLAALDDDDNLVTGLSLYMRSGSTVLSRPAPLLQEQIETVRRMGIHGYCLFALSHLSDEQLQTLQDQINTQPAKPYYRP